MSPLPGSWLIALAVLTTFPFHATESLPSPTHEIDAAIMTAAPGEIRPSSQPLVAVAVDSTAGFRPVLSIGPVLENPSLREAISSGIPIRVHTRVELWRDGFFDDLAGSEAWSTVVLYEPLAERYVVRAPDTRGTALQYETYDAARAAIEGRRTLALRPARTGNYYFTATLVIETLSLSDIEELQRWLQGELQPAVSGDRSLPGALGEGAKRLVVRLLRLPTRRIEARSPRFRVSALPGDSPQS